MKDKNRSSEFEDFIIKAFYYLKQFKFYLTPMFFSIYSFIYGIQFIFRTKEAYRTSDIYVAISAFMNLQTYGYFLMTASIIMGISLFFNSNVGRSLLALGAFINFILFLFYAIIATYSAGMQSTVALRVTFAFFNLFLAIFSILELKVDNIVNERK